MQREQRLSNVLLGLFSGLSLLLLALPSASTIQSVKAFLSYTVHPGPRSAFWTTEALREIPSNVAELIRADQENRKLREDLKTVALLESRISALETENDRLRSLVGFAKPPQWRPIWARVMGLNPQTWYRELLLDRGRDAGIDTGDPVVAVDAAQEPAAEDEPPLSRLGVVGKIVEVTPNTAKVLLVTDDLSSIAASVGPEGFEGLIEGDGRPLLKLNYLSEGAALQAGMQVVTSPVSPSFPPGLPIGTVVRLGTRDPFLAFQSAEVQPAARIGAVKEVMVLRRSGS